MVINYKNSEIQARETADNINKKGGHAVCVKADVSKSEEASLLIEKSIEEFGDIDLLVNNAGISQQKLFTDISENDWDNMIDTNLKSVFLCSKAVLPYFISKKSGNIINISSMWGITGASCEVHYSASKAGVIGLTKALAKEVAPSGIRVNCIAPGVIDTDMNKDMDRKTIGELKTEILLGRLGTAGDVAGTVLFLAGEGSGFITSQVISVDGGRII